jgi:hypothetical protein
MTKKYLNDGKFVVDIGGEKFNACVFILKYGLKLKT